MLTKTSPAAPKMSTTLAVAFFSLSAVVLLVYSGWQIFHEFKRHEGFVLSKQQLIAQDAARTVSGFIQDSFRMLETAVWVTDLYALSEMEQQRILRSLVGRRSALRGVVLLDARNEVRAGSFRLSREASGALRDRLKEVLSGEYLPNNRMIGPVYIDAVTSEPMLTLAVRMTDVFGGFQGTLLAELNLKYMWDVVDRIKVGATGYAYVCDRQGRVLAFRDTGLVLKGRNVSRLKTVADFMVSHPSEQLPNAVRYQGILGSTVLGSYAPLQTPDWAVVAELPWEEVYRVLMIEVATAAGITLVMAILAGLFGILLARRLAAPVINLTEAASRIAAGERDLRAKIGGPREVAHLALAFNSMTSQLQRSLQDLGQQFADLQRTEETLRKNEAVLKSLLEATPAGVGLAVDRVLHRINGALCRITGYAEEELIGKDTRIFFADDEEYQRVGREAYGQMQREGLGMLETRLRHKGGAAIDVLMCLCPFDPRDTSAGVTATILDITESKRARRALEESERKFRDLVEKALVGVFLIQDGGFKYVNAQLADGLGYPIEELLGEVGVEDVIVAEDWPTVREKFRQRDSGELLSAQYGFKVRTKDQAIRHVEVYSSTTIYQGRPAIIGTVLDVTERYRGEEEMRRLRNYLINVINSMPSVLVGVDLDGRVTQWNVAAEQATGVTAESAQGQPLDRLLPTLSQQLNGVRRAMPGQTVKTAVKVPRSVGGETRYEDITVYPLVSDGIEGAVIRVDDVTERARIDEMMVQSEKMLSVGGLAAGMAHEINNPLGVILQALQNVFRRVAPDLPANIRAAEKCGVDLTRMRRYLEAREIFVFLDDIRQSGERAAAIVANMLSFSRKTEGKGTPADIAELLERTVPLAASDYDLKKHYDFRQIEVVREYQPGVPPVTCQAAKIQQVFLNILRNGAEAMRMMKTVGQSPRFVLRVLGDEKMVRVEIEDNGPGMDEATRKRVFEPFFTTKPPGSGTGLGLSVSYFIITEDHGGIMTVESNPGAGSRFIIQLPVEGKQA